MKTILLIVLAAASVSLQAQTTVTLDAANQRSFDCALSLTNAARARASQPALSAPEQSAMLNAAIAPSLNGLCADLERAEKTAFEADTTFQREFILRFNKSTAEERANALKALAPLEAARAAQSIAAPKTKK